MKAGIEKYVNHLPDCNSLLSYVSTSPPCNCGLDLVVSKIASQAAEITSYPIQISAMETQIADLKAENKRLRKCIHANQIGENYDL